MTTDRPRQGPQQRPDFVTAAAKLDRATYENLRRALALGRWPDGRRLEPRQREICMETVALWEAAHLPPEQRTGYVEPNACSSKQQETASDRIRLLGDDQ